MTSAPRTAPAVAFCCVLSAGELVIVVGGWVGGRFVRIFGILKSILLVICLALVRTFRLLSSFYH